MDAQELRRRWTDKTNAVFGPRDRIDYQEYPAENYEREVDFRGCRSIVFLHGERTGTEEDVLLLAQGSGHMTLPAGVMMLVESGFCKWVPAASAGGGSTVVGMGVRAPPSSRVSGYARSSADSGYSGQARGQAASTYRPSPPRDAASFTRSGPGSSYMSACNVPLPQSTVVGRRSSADSDDWEVVGQMRMDDACSIAPSESISSVGSRGGAMQYSRRYNQGY
ncbi:hypothetical protein C8A05DRAFT_30661 [Staphylotrichum tortipilum]|uniref:Uncharacterized protein n=1 Tax=Staphylotrichum tortipilum TaxID=2831512 RepID=A0AAN6RW00_9PEZI|nr:hypothetical protein C8A05DRAFT_30661 [Staphylotrichum longicolle]